MTLRLPLPGSSGSRPGVLLHPTCSPPHAASLFPDPARRTSALPAGEGGTEDRSHSASLRAPLATVTRPSWGRPNPETRAFLPAARTPPASLAWPRRPQPSAPGFSFGPFFLGLTMGCLVRKLQQMEKRPSLLPLLYPREEKDTPRPFVFDSCPTLHYPGYSRRRSPLWIQGAGHCRRSIRDKNQLLPEGAAAIDTRARRVAPFFSRGSPSNSDSAREGEG